MGKCNKFSRGKKLVEKSLRDEENSNEIPFPSSEQNSNLIAELIHGNKPLQVPETSSNIIETGNDLINFKYNLRKRTPVKPTQQALSVTETEEPFSIDESEYKPNKTASCCSNSINASSETIDLNDVEQDKITGYKKETITPQKADSKESFNVNITLNNFTIEIEEIEKDYENKQSTADDTSIALEQITRASNSPGTDQEVAKVFIVPAADIIVHKNDLENKLEQERQSITQNILLNNKKGKKISYSISELEEIRVCDDDENKSENCNEKNKKRCKSKKKAKSIALNNSNNQNQDTTQIAQNFDTGIYEKNNPPKEKEFNKLIYRTSELEEKRIFDEKENGNEKVKSTSPNDSNIQVKATSPRGLNIETKIYEEQNNSQQQTLLCDKNNNKNNSGKRNMPEKENPGRKRIRNESQWKSVVMKTKKNSGEEYTNRKGKLVPKKEMKSGCSYNCLRECRRKITEKERQNIFVHFWALSSHDKQIEFVSRFVRRVPKKQIRVSSHPSRRRWSYEYYIMVNKEETRVCKKMFLDTLSITDMWIQTIFLKIDKLGSGVMLKDGRGCHKNHRITITQDVKQSIRDHISAIPVVESHYVRARSSKLYFDETLNVPKLYAMYESWMQDNYPNQMKATLRQYRDIFSTEFNIDFNKPKKDLCLKCDIYKKASALGREELEYEHALHIANKTIVRTLKEKDKKRSEESSSVITACYDLQKILSTPQSEVSIFYYKRKLSVYNFTVFEIGNKKGYSYLWNETIGKKGANEISSFVYDFIEKHVEKGAKEFIFYSDGCGGQNKNKIVFGMYSKACQTFQINITHNFFEMGHSQSEGDSMHALIEKRKKNQTIYTPSQWAPLIKCAKTTGTPYNVTEVSQSNIYDFKKYSEAFNWTYDTDHKKIGVSKIKHVHFNKDAPHIMHFQYNFYCDTEMTINLIRKDTTHINRSNRQRGRRTNRGRGRSKQAVHTVNEASQARTTVVEITHAYNAPLPISSAKFNDLMSLCTSLGIPEIHHEYYKNIPHAENKKNRSEESSDYDST